MTNFASKWRIFGTLLGLSNEKLCTIEHDNQHQAENCCHAMLAEWNKYDPTASHEEIQRTKGLLSRIAKLQPFVQRRSLDEVGAVKPSLFYKPSLPRKPGSTHQASPSAKPHQFIKLVLMLHKSNDITKEDALSVASVMYTGNIAMTYANNIQPVAAQVLPDAQTSSNYYSRCNKYTDIMDIFVELHHSETQKPLTLLLEGGPGMGKTTLCKEAYYKLSEGNKYELAFLVSLHNPKFQEINSFEAFFELYCCKTSQKSLQDVKNYLDKTNGKNVLIVVDGYDELVNGQHANTSSFTDDIVYRRYYPLVSCDLIISSRQPESAQLSQYHCTNCTRVEILGFTDDLKHRYITQCCAEKDNVLREFLKKRSFLHSVCCFPFFLANLVSLFKASKLPSSETEVIDRLVCSMISWCLQVQPPSNNVSITTWYEELPSECQCLLKEVSKCAYTAYQNNTFILDLDGLSCNLQYNGLGLLRAFDFVFSDVYEKCFAFAHHSIQEFLVSFHLFTLPNGEQEYFRDQNMWSSKYMNIWFHYCGLVIDNHNIIKMLFTGSWYGRLFGGDALAMSDILQDRIKCLYLAYCFMQSPDDSIYRKVSTIVKVDDKVLDVSNSNLAIEDLTIIYLFLSRCSLKEWKCFNLSKCNLDNNKLTEVLLKLPDLCNGNTVHVAELNFAENNIKLSNGTFFTFMSMHSAHHCILTHNNITNDQITTAILSMTEKQRRILVDQHLQSIQNSNSQFLFHTCVLTYLDNSWATIPLVELYLIRCQFSGEVVDHLCSALRRHFTLSLLFLYDNGLLCSYLVKIVDSLKVSSKLSSFLLHEKSLLDKVLDDINQTLSIMSSISQLLLVNAGKLIALQMTDYQIILALKYSNSIVCFQLGKCHITHKVMAEVATLFNNSSTPCNVLDMSDSRVDDSHLEILVNVLDPEVTITSLSLPVTVSSLTLAELICCVYPSSVNISSSLTDDNNQSVGMVVAENLFTSQRQSTVMLSCDNEKVGIFHKLDYSSCIVENTSQLTQLFIDNCTIDGEVLANSLDNSESVVLLHLSNIKWDAEVFYTTNSFIKNKRVTISVCENSLPGIVKQNLLNTIDADGNLSRIISTDDIFIAHSCSYELVRWHLTQEVSCDPQELFYMCNCLMKPDPELFENYFNYKGKINEVILNNNGFSKQTLNNMLSIINQLSLKQICICENTLNCNWAVNLLSNIPYFTIVGSNMVISVRDSSEHITRAINLISEASRVIRLINCEIDLQCLESLADAICKCKKLQQFTLSGGIFSAIHGSICATLLEALSKIESLTHLSFDNHKLTFELMKNLRTVISNNSQLEEVRLNNLDLKAAIVLNICPAIASLNNIKILSLNGNIMSEKAAVHLAAALSKKLSLHSLCLANTNLRTEGAIKIANALQTIKTLKILMLNNNEITEAASESIAAAIASNTGLEKLYLDNNFLGAQGYTNIVSALKHLENLKVLHLKNNKLQYQIEDIMQDVICTNVHLETMCFDSNYLYTKGGEKMTYSSVKTQIKSIGLSGNKLTSEAADHIADIISKSTKIEKVQVYDNYLGTEGCNIITVALKNISTLTKLYISNNNITEQAADGIAEVISRNMSLQVLDIGSNFLLTTGIVKIAKVLRILHNVKELCVNKNFITEEAADDIAAVITSNAKLEKLQLSDNLLKTAGANKICSALKQISCVRVFLFCNNNISQHSAGSIASVIMNNPFIETLALGHNKLQSAGATIIAKALQHNCNLKSLHLEKNQIDFEAASDIAAAITCNSGLEKLWLHDNILRTEGVICVNESLEKVTKLKLYQIENNNITDEVVNSMIMVISKHSSFLETVWISEDSISPSVIGKFTSQLKSLSTLKTLTLNNNHISYEAAGNIANAIANNTGLEKLRLHNTDLMDSGLTRIAKVFNCISSLRILHLGNNHITASSADNLAVLIASNPLLECVHLGNNKLQSAGVKELVCAFKKLYYLKELKLNDNYLRENAASDIAEIVNCKTKLEKLWVNNNNLKSVGIKEMCKVLNELSSLKLLHLENNHICDDAASDIASVIRNNMLLENVYLRSNNFQMAGVLVFAKEFAQLYCLKDFSLHNEQVTDETAAKIADIYTNNTRLNKFSLFNSILTNKGVNKATSALCLQRINLLKCLHLGGYCITESVVDTISAAIICNPLLEEIAVISSKLGTVGITALMNALKRLFYLKVLTLNDNEIEEDAGKNIAEVINNNTGLEKLYLNNNNLKGVGVKQLCEGITQHTSFKLLQLEDNDITGEAADALGSLIRKSKLLEIICLGNNRLETADVDKLSNALKCLRNLKILTMFNNHFSELASNGMAEVCMKNSSLQMLWLWNNSLNDTGICRIACALRTIHTLNVLYMSDNNFTDKTADDITAVIASNPLLEHINLGDNRLGSRGVIKLAGYLKILHYLKTLSLTGTEIKKDTARHIAEVICNNPGLEKLYLNNNQLRGLGMKRLCEGIKQHSSFKVLQLENNDITEEAANGLAVVISNNRLLEELYLGKNLLQTSGLKMLKNGI